MTTIALTGGIASGKTTIANRLRELGAVVIDADEIAREITVAGSPVLRAIRERFGDGVITESGELDRKALAAIVFADEDALRALNDITHPVIRDVTNRRIETVREEDPDAVFVHDIPLLAENRSNYDYDEIWVADAPAEERLERLIADRGMTRAEAQARIDAQVSDEERRMIADVVIDTMQPMAETITLVDELFARLRETGRAASEDVHYDELPQRTPEEERIVEP